MNDSLTRRRFLLHSFTGVSAAWVTSHWPAALAAAEHAHAAARSATPPKFEFFTLEQAAEIDAVTSRIIPTDETPGAREAGVVYFIDRALKTFASDSQKLFSDGLPELQARAREMYPGVEKFSAATPEQQDEILRSLDKDSPVVERPFRSRPEAQHFFETLRSFTIHGFLIDPDSDKGGNRDGVGWKVIGREREHTFQPPFGYYDKDYPGWQPPSKDADKK
jgi:gluconate 2-dehydrogenase subunit 3-like protein